MHFTNSQCQDCARAEAAPAPISTWRTLLKYGISFFGFAVFLWLLPRTPFGYTIVACVMFVAVQLFLYVTAGRAFLHGNIVGRYCYLFRDARGDAHIHLRKPSFKNRMEEVFYVRFRLGGYHRSSEVLPRDGGFGRPRWKIRTWDGQVFQVSDDEGHSLMGIDEHQLLWLLDESNGGTDDLMETVMLTRVFAGMDLNSPEFSSVVRLDECNRLGVVLQKVLLRIRDSKDGYDTLPQEVRALAEHAVAKFRPSRREAWKQIARKELDEEAGREGDSPKNPPLAN